ncbi:hypothetical protein JTB14_009862 [Gonioctena quinquepunctata]|nr:hypothetical protein JTB14_009862 [Gonioctena quinquepunctata]
MVRNYKQKTDRSQIDGDTIESAVADVLAGILSIRKAAENSNKSAVDEFYANYEILLARQNFTPVRILNFDEIGRTTVLNTPKVLSEKKQRQAGQLVSAERGKLVMFCGIITATGNSVPPIYIFPRVHYKDHFQKGAPEGSLGLATKSGWMNADLFINALQHIMKHTSCSKENPVLLLCDNYESHIQV